MSSDVANLYVTLTADTAEYKAKMAEAEGAGTLLQSNIQGVGKASTEHIGGTATHNVGLLESAFGKVDSAIGGVLKSMASMIGQSAGIGALFGGGAIIADAVKQAEDYNVAMAGVNTAFKNIHQNTPTPFINSTTTAMRALGQSDVSTLTSIQQMTEAHIPLADQMQVLQAATDLSVGKNVDLQTALKAVEMGAQGAGARLFTQFGINLPAVIPKVASLTSATLAQHKAQEALTLATDKYGDHSPQVLAAQQKLGDATAKVNTITQEQANHWQNLAGFSGQVEGLFGGLASAKVAADPLAQLGIEFQHIAEVGGQALLPFVHQFADYIQNHMPDIEKTATGAFHDLGTAVSDTAGFFKNDLWPIAQTVIGFISDHKQDIKDVALALGAIYGVHKVVSTGSSLVGDLQKILGLTGVTGGGGGGGIGVQKVWVMNPGFGGGPPGGIPPVVTGAGEATTITSLITAGLPVAVAVAIAAGLTVGLVNTKHLHGKTGSTAADQLGLVKPVTAGAGSDLPGNGPKNNANKLEYPGQVTASQSNQMNTDLADFAHYLHDSNVSSQSTAGAMSLLSGVMATHGPLTASDMQNFETEYSAGVTTLGLMNAALFPAPGNAQNLAGSLGSAASDAAALALKLGPTLTWVNSLPGLGWIPTPAPSHPSGGGGDVHVHGNVTVQANTNSELFTQLRQQALTNARSSGVNSLWGSYG